MFRLSSLHRSLGNAQSGQSGPRDPSKPRSGGAVEFFFEYLKKELCRNIKIKSVFMVSAKIHQEVSQREWVVPNSHHKQVSWQNDKQLFYFMFGLCLHDKTLDNPNFQFSMYSNVVRTTRINVNGILIEYEGEDSGIGLLFASKAAVQVMKVRFWI